MRVFGAMLLDSYRELNSKKLFWVILALSGFVVLFYGSMGFDETGMSLFYGLKHFDNPIFAYGSPAARTLYRSIFSTMLVTIWLGFIATILALLSTTTIFPDFIAGGSIDLVLSKPIGRVRVFFMKYLASLLFVVLQLTVFCVGIFLCMGLRLGDWNWEILAAIPVVTIFYSYIYSVNVLIGVWTRSALTALLGTMMLWFSLLSINSAEAMMNRVRTQHEVKIETLDQTITDARTRIAELQNAGAAPEAMTFLHTDIDRSEMERDRSAEALATLEPWYTPISVTEMIFPKGGETIGLLDRWLKRDSDMNMIDIMQGNVGVDASGDIVTLREDTGREALLRLEQKYEGKSLWYVVGTSLLFEGLVLSLACWIFVRRDY